MRRRRRGLGVLGTMAVGGVAYAAGNSTAKGRAAEDAQNAEIEALQSQLAASPPPPQPQPATPGPAPSSMDDKLAQLQKLAELRSAGVITDEDVAIQKARILAT